MDRAVRGVFELARSVLAELDLDAVLDRVLEAAQELTGARCAALGVFDGSRNELSRFLTREVDGATPATIEALPRGHSPTRAFLGAPILVDGQPFGDLYLTAKAGGEEFSAEDEQALGELAELAGMAIDHARRAAGERRRQRLAAAEGERRRWARELHDDTLQSLSALRIGLSTAARSRQPEALREASRQAVAQLEEAIANLRALIADLRPGALDELGTQAAVEALAERATRHGIEVDVSIELAHERMLERDEDGGEALPTRHTTELETAIYRIVQEALTNAAKHGRAERAIVEIHEAEETVRVEVRDDGGGFDTSADTSGFGLLGMRERAELLDGTLRVDSAPGAGTTVRADFPVRRRAGAAETRPLTPG